jgi:hypothetical protein
MKTICLAIAMVAIGCKPCDDACEEVVELSFVPMAGMLASTSYTIVLSDDTEVATCEIAVDAAFGDERECQGEAVVFMSDMVDDGGTSGGEGSGGGVPHVVVRWSHAPMEFDLVVRNATNVLVTSNTLTPAYQDQGVMACDGECRRFESEIALSM